MAPEVRYHCSTEGNARMKGGTDLSTHETAETLVPVHVCWTDAEADVVISYLEAHGVPAVARSSGPRSVYPVTVDGLGQVSVLVDGTLTQRAKGLLDRCEDKLGQA